MEQEKFDCMICSYNFVSVASFKKHLRLFKHKVEYKKVYQNDDLFQNGFTPWIFIKDLSSPYSGPVLGLSQMTLCFCSEQKKSFYLCHVCEQHISQFNVVRHISDVNHFNSYFAHTNPNALGFLSLPSENNMNILMDNIKEEQQKTGVGKLQVLHMPEKLFQECNTETYRQVMFLLNQNKSLSDIFEEKITKRVTVQTYKDDSNRKHSLIGLKDIVECVCVSNKLRHYLCKQCGLHVTCNNITRHLLSFDHIVAHYSKLHPSKKKCSVKERPDLVCTLTEFAKQSEKLHGPQEMQQVRLEPSQMLSVLSSTFEEAVSKVESFAHKDNLKPVAQEQKLEPTLSGSGQMSNVKQEILPEPVTSGTITLIQNIQEENDQSKTPARPSYSFYCQNCSENFKTNTLYCDHLSTSEHNKSLMKTFGAVMDRQHSRCKPHFHSYQYFTENGTLCVGVSLVVTILSHTLSLEPVHLCFACEAVFPTRELSFHMNSLKHAVQYLLYQNPWKLPFAFKTRLDSSLVNFLACAEEGERGPQKNIRILDVPPCLFPSGTLNYSQVMEKLSRYHPLLMRGVPKRETYSKLQDNDRFPILGRNFLVKYGQTCGWNFLCLLCKHQLPLDNYFGHVFSWEHVVAFLETFHPGSLDLKTANEEMLLDLAKQAAHIHHISNEQEIDIDTSQHELEQKDYSTKVHLLSAKKARDGKGSLIPSVAPNVKLFPRQQAQDTKETNVFNAVRSILSIPENPVEKVVDIQPAAQVSQVEINEPTEISLKETNNLLAEQELKEIKDTSKQCQFEEKKTAESSSADGISRLRALSKRQRSVSDMDSDMENPEPKQQCQTTVEEKKIKTNFQNMDTTNTCSSSASNSVPCSGSVLRSYIQRKTRGPLIGLSAIYECICDDFAPIYLCKCCHLKFKEQHITRHLGEIWHYKSYLHTAGEYPLPMSTSWKKDIAKYAAYWEKKEGHGKAHVVKLSPEDYKLISTCDYYKSFSHVKKCLSENLKENTLSPSLHKSTATIVSTNREKTSKQMETEALPNATSLKTEHQSKNEMDSKSNKDANLNIIPDLKQSAVLTLDVDNVSYCLPGTVAGTSSTPTSSSSSLSNDGKSLEITRDESEGIDIEDTSLEIENATRTGEPKASKPVCKAKPTGKSVGNCMIAESATRNMSTTKPVSIFNSDIVTPDTGQATSPMTVDKGPNSIPIFCATSAATKGDPKPEDNSVLPKDVPKCKADSAIYGDKVANNHLSAKKTTTDTAAPDTSIPKTSDVQLKLNVNIASHVKNNDPGLSLTPTSPNFVSLMPTTETNHKVSHQSPLVGVDQLVEVKCKEKKRVYCFACSVSLEATNHLTSTTHQINSVKMKFPLWSAKPGDEDLSKMVAQLHNDEKASKMEAKKIEVSLDVYKKVKALPDKRAIQKIRSIIKKGSNQLDRRKPSASKSELSNSQCDTSMNPNILVQCSLDVTSPNIAKENIQTFPKKKSNTQSKEKLSASATCLPSLSPPVQKCEAPRIINGSAIDGRSNLSHILEVRDVSVIGLSLVWECRVAPPKCGTFYLCESCSLTIVVSEICHHLESTKHYFNYLMKRYPQFMYWVEEQLHPSMSNHLADYIADLLKGREESIDAQAVLLSEECSVWVRTAPFVQALNVVQRIKRQKTTTLLPLIAMSQEDLPNQEETSIIEKAGGMDTPNEMHTSGYVDNVNTKPSSTPPDSVPSPEVTDLLDPHSPCFASSNSPKQPPEPANFVTDQNLPSSPKYENQEDCDIGTKTFSYITSPLSHNLAALHSTVETSLVIPKDKSRDSEPKADARQASPSIQEASTVIPKLFENNVPRAIEEDQMEEECSPHSQSDTNGESTSLMTSTIVDHNANENPPLDPEDNAALDKHYCLLLINLLKQAKNSMQKTAPLKNQESVPCTGKMRENDAEQHEAWDVGQPPKIDATAEVDNAMTGNKKSPSAALPSENITSDSGVSNENTEKSILAPMASSERPSVSSENLNERSISVVGTQKSQEQPVQSKDEECVGSNIQKQFQLQKIELQQKEIKTLDMRTEENVLNSQVSMKTSQIEIQATQTKSQYNNAVLSKVELSQCQAVQKKKLQLKSDTQEALLNCPPCMSDALMKDAQFDSGALQLQTQQSEVQAIQQADTSDLQLQQQILMVQSQTDTQQRQWSIAEGQLHIQQPQQQMQTQNNIQQTQGQTEQMPIEALIIPRQHKTKYFRREAEEQQSICYLNSRFQMSQGPPVSSAATPPVTSGPMMVTGEYGQFVQTARLTNAYVSNTQGLYGLPQHTAGPSHFYHQMQTQQHVTSGQPFFQNFQYPQISESVRPHYSGWPNGAGGSTLGTHVALSNAVLFNSVNNQSYTYNFNSVEEYNRFLVQDVFYSPSTPSQMNNPFFPHRQ